MWSMLLPLRRRPVVNRRRARPVSIAVPERFEPRRLLAVTVPPDIVSNTVEIDDNVLVGAGPATIEATGAGGGYVQIFGNSRGRIDAVTAGAGQLTLKAKSAITVTGAIGSVAPLEQLTLWSTTGQAVNLQQAVTLADDLTIAKAGSVTVGGPLTVGDDLTITEATSVLFAGNVHVAGDLTISAATSVTFAGTLTVGGVLTITDVTGTTRFTGDVTARGASVTSTSLVQVLGGFRSTGGDGHDGDVTFTTNQINLSTAVVGTTANASGQPSATLVIQPRTASRDLTIGSPPGIPSGLSITDADIFAIQSGWKRVVFGNETGGTGAVTVGSIGSQYGGFSMILNTTTIVGGSIQVVQPVDATTDAAYLEFLARSGGITVKAPINQTAAERNDWLRLTAAGPIALEAPVWANQTASLTTFAGGTISQGQAAAAVTASHLAVVADGAVTLADSGNAFDTVAVRTSDDDVVLREDSGYSIGETATSDTARDVPASTTVTGVDAGTAAVRLVTVSTSDAASVSQTKRISAASLRLEGAGTYWNLGLPANAIGTLTAETGGVKVFDADAMSVGTIVASQRSGTAVELSAPSGLAVGGPVTTSGGDVLLRDAVTLSGDAVVDVADGAATGTVVFLSTVDGTKSGQQSLVVVGNLDARASIGGTTALKSLSVSGDSTFAGGIGLRTTGDQAYSGKAASTGTISVGAGSGSTVKFLGDATLGGLVTALGDYAVALVGSKTAISSAVTFSNSGAVTLGDQSTDDLHVAGGLSTAAASGTFLAGTIRTTDTFATFGQRTPAARGITLTADTIVSTGAGAATFAGTVDGSWRLVVNTSGDTTFSSAVGGKTALASLVTDAGGTTNIDGGSIVTSGAAGQTYGDDVTLGDHTTLTGDSITTLGTVTGQGHDLTIAGVATLGDAAGDVATGIASLAVTGDAVVNAANVAATVIQTWKKTVTLGTDATFQGGVLSFEGPVVGAGHDLSLAGSSVVLGDAPTDSVTGVDDLVVTGATVLNGNTITTTGTQTFDGPVTATMATAVVLSGQAFDFKQAIGRGEPSIVAPLTITAGSGGVAFGGDVGTMGRPFGAVDVRSQGGVVVARELHATGAVTITSTEASITGAAGTALRTPLGTVRLDAATGIGRAAAAIGIEAAGVTAATAAGGIFLRGAGESGNLWIGKAGLTAPGSIGVDARNVIGVYAGGRIQAGGGVGSTLPISWQVATTDDGGPGSLRQVLQNINEVGNANAAGTDATVSFDLNAPAGPVGLVFTLATSLPEIQAAVEFVGFGIVLDGAGTASSGLVLGTAASGSTLQGVTLRNFRDYALQMRSTQNVTIDRVQVRGLNLITSMGLYAAGDLTGSRITGSEFTSGLRGALLDNARGLRIGATTPGQGNVFADNRSVPGKPNFAGTGIRAQGVCTGTVVEGNSFTGNNYGFGFVAARGIVLRQNVFARNSIAAIHIDGNCTGSVQVGNTFASARPDRNKATVVRTRTARGL